MLDYKLYSDLDYHQIYINASKELIEVFRNEIVELHHIGSTSIEGVSVNTISRNITGSQGLKQA